MVFMVGFWFLVAVDAETLEAVPQFLHLGVCALLHLPRDDRALDDANGVALLRRLLECRRVTREGEEVLEFVECNALLGAGFEVAVRFADIVAPETEESALRDGVANRRFGSSRFAESVDTLTPLDPSESAGEVAATEERDLAPLPRGESGIEGVLFACCGFLGDAKDLTLVEPGVAPGEVVVLHDSDARRRRGRRPPRSGAHQSARTHANGEGDKGERGGVRHFEV